MKWTRSCSAMAIALILSSSASAQVYGSMANFDAVNDTGGDCQGFDIEIDDPSYDHTKLISVFGLDINFGVLPTFVERYGAPTITDLPGVGVRVRYQAGFVNGAWTQHTPSGPYPFAGDSCWPLGNPLYNTGTLTCDHFGVAMLNYATPARVTYNWLCDKGAGGSSGVLTRVPASVPPVDVSYGAAVGTSAVRFEIKAHPEPNRTFGKAYWVKTYSRHVNHPVGVDELMLRAPDVPSDFEVQAEWDVFQAGGDNGSKRTDLVKAPADQAIVVRYAFYGYVGGFKASGEVDCAGSNQQNPIPDNCGGLGPYAGAQIAAFNAVVPTPEPLFVSTSAVGVFGLGALARRRVPRR